MKRGKNYLRIPPVTLEMFKKEETDYFQIVGVILAYKKDIKNGMYKDLSIIYENDVLHYAHNVIPPICNGRYSMYNRKGRSIIRKDLPKIHKYFSHEVYPYGDTSKMMVDASFWKEVWQRDEWLPEQLSLNIELKEENDTSCCFLVKSEEIIDRRSRQAEFRLLFNINLISENCGNFQLIGSNSEVEYVLKTLNVDWELLPPGHVDIEYVDRYFGKKSENEQKEILERFEYIKSLKPKQFIRGTSQFSQYFGAIMSNDVVVLENTHVGNAIYVFYDDWEVLSKLSRTELIRMNSDKVVRIQHRGNWKKILCGVIECKI